MFLRSHLGCRPPRLRAQWREGLFLLAGAGLLASPGEGAVPRVLCPSRRAQERVHSKLGEEIREAPAPAPAPLKALESLYSSHVDVQIKMTSWHSRQSRSF
uniref:Putative secreted protein n=1 Tax=Ixodes ricinus TaxID=34613 RepID=A0A6B0U6E3_IXORI